MSEREFLTAISVLTKEIDMLKFENEQLQKANDNLVDQIGAYARLYAEVKHDEQ